MAISKNNVLTFGLIGKTDALVFRRFWGRTVVWLPYKASPPFTLSNGSGLKKVYFAHGHFRHCFGANPARRDGYGGNERNRNFVRFAS